MSTPTIYNGLCIGGPLDKQRIASEKPTIEHLDPVADLFPMEDGGKAEVRRQVYKFVRVGPLGMWQHETVGTTEALMTRLLTTYERS